LMGGHERYSMWAGAAKCVQEKNDTTHTEIREI
jgi:hypothetical protein